MNVESFDIKERCRLKLIEERDKRLVQLDSIREALGHSSVKGDEGDMAKALEDQHIYHAQRDTLIHELREIEEALHRIANGIYGVCEETEEPIEPRRLLALPWTRLSREGAELRDRVRRRIAA